MKLQRLELTRWIEFVAHTVGLSAAINEQINRRTPSRLHYRLVQLLSTRPKLRPVTRVFFIPFHAMHDVKRYSCCMNVQLVTGDAAEVFE
jgi:hypothetical protein